MKDDKNIEKLDIISADEEYDYTEDNEQNDKKKLVYFELIMFMLFLFASSVFLFSKIFFHSKPVDNYVMSGFVIFSYEEATNGVNLVDAYPVSDEVGKSNNKKGEYFDFSVGVSFKNSRIKNITYEISLTPLTSSLEYKYVKINLIENGKEVLINDKKVSRISELKASSIRKDSYFLRKVTVDKYAINKYTFRMWLSSDYELDGTNKTFRCIINVDAY